MIVFRSGWLQISYCMLLPASSTRCSFWHNWTVSEISSNGYPGVQRCPGFTQQRCSVERRGILCFLPVQQGPADPSEGKSQMSFRVNKLMPRFLRDTTRSLLNTRDSNNQCLAKLTCFPLLSCFVQRLFRWMDPSCLA